MSARGALRLAALLTAAALPVRAGPLDARRLLDEAREALYEAWPARVARYRRALAAAHPSDPTYGRALAGLAGVLGEAGFVEGALAFRARQAACGSARDRGRLAAALDLALALRREGDLEAAAPLLEEVESLARAPDARLADRALEARGLDALDRGEGRVLEALAAKADRVRAAPSARLRLWDGVGRQRLAAGDVRGARRALTRAEQAWRDSERAEPEEATRAARLWLDLDLRRRVAAADG